MFNPSNFLGSLQKVLSLENEKKTSFSFAFCSLIRTIGYAECRLHLGKTKKNKLFFGFSLGLHYLCTRYIKGELNEQ